MVELTDLDGVGPARSDSLIEAGYENMEDISGADPEELSEEVNVSEDTALGFVVQAENMLAEEEAEVTEDEPTSVTEEIEEAQESDEEDEVVAGAEMEPESEEDETVEEDEPKPEDATVEIELVFDSGLEHDVLFAATMRHMETMLQGNRTQTEVFESVLDQMRTAGVDEGVTVEVEPEDLNELHNAVRKMVTYYQGNNLIDHMNATKQIQNQVNEYRQEYLF